MTHNCSCAYNPQSTTMAQNDAMKYIPHYESPVSISLPILYCRYFMSFIIFALLPFIIFTLFFKIEHTTHGS